MKEEQIIKMVLERSMKGCSFKQAFIPKGWTCVNIEKCAKHIVKELEDGRSKEK